MGWLTTSKGGTTEQVPASMEDRLEWLCGFGVPRISKADKGWHARIEMNTNTTGSKFEVITEFNHDRPSVAVDELIRRMLNTLAQLRTP